MDKISKIQKQNKIPSLKDIPGVGPSIMKDLLDLGITSIDSLKYQDPQKLYERLCDIRGVKVDKCMLYVFRCAVYFSKNSKPEPQKLLWWDWKD